MLVYIHWIPASAGLKSPLKGPQGPFKPFKFSILSALFQSRTCFHALERPSLKGPQGPFKPFKFSLNFYPTFKSVIEIMNIDNSRMSVSSLRACSPVCMFVIPVKTGIQNTVSSLRACSPVCMFVIPVKTGIQNTVSSLRACSPLKTGIQNTVSSLRVCKLSNSLQLYKCEIFTWYWLCFFISLFFVLHYLGYS